MWTSLTSPSGVVTTRAERIPSRVVSRFSARRTPQGSGASPPSPPDGVLRPGWEEASDCFAALNGHRDVPVAECLWGQSAAL